MMQPERDRQADPVGDLERLSHALGVRAAIVRADGTVRFGTPAWNRSGGGRPLLEILEAEGGLEAALQAREALEELVSGSSDIQELEYAVAPATATDDTEPAQDPTDEGVVEIPRAPGWHRLRLVRVETHPDAPPTPPVFAAEIADVTRHKSVQSALRSRERRLKLTNLLLRELSERDPLTSLWNRRGLERVLQREQRQCRRSGRPLSTLLIDCDDFKRVNDRFGHAAGDRMLRRLGRVLQVELRPRDAAARVGGDEFVVLLPDTDLRGAHAIAERLRARIEEALGSDGEFLAASATVSLGVAEAGSAVSLEQILRTTQDALKAAKSGGKNRVVGIRADDGAPPATAN